MKHCIFMPLLSSLTLLLSGLGIQSAYAGDQNLMPSTVPPIYKQECGSCHMAYPPALLPKESWLDVMGGLSKHYGTDASLDQREMAQIQSWLMAHAATYKRVKEAPPENKITKSNWFERKHRKVPARDFSKPSVKSASNCNACHLKAEQGNFDDDEARIPK